MREKQRTVSIPGSNRPVVPEAKVLGMSDPTQRIKVSIYARQNPHPSEGSTPSIEQLSYALPGKRQYLKREAFNAIYGADPADLKKIADWAQACKLKVIDSSVAMRRVLVEGTIADVNAAFGVELRDYEHPITGRYRGRQGKIYIPEELGGVIEGVEGLDTRQTGRKRCRRGRWLPVDVQSLKPQAAKTEKGGVPAAHAVVADPFPGTFFPPQVGQLYDYPPNLDGTGQNIAVFAFNGGTGGDPHGGYNLAALNIYFEKVLGSTTPRITDVVIQGPGNDPGPETKASGERGDSTDEVMLDMCVVGSVAPGAHIFMYFTEFTTQGWVDALHTAVTDDNQISVISISYGNPEDDPQGAWTPMGINLVNQVFQAAIAQGITICCASGDDGSLDDERTGAHVDFPASSPFVLGVGGTRLVANSSNDPTSMTDETVWNELSQGGGAGGGGISSVFPKPEYQNGVTVPPSADPPHKIGRGVPDVSALADPETGVAVMHINGKQLDPVGGTSASAPLWAALIARINQGLQARCGFLNPLLYTKFAKGVLRDITVGNNGAYEAGPGWDACTGLGSPQGQNLLKALAGGSVKTKVIRTRG
jgi:kumamolisin